MVRCGRLWGSLLLVLLCAPLGFTQGNIAWQVVPDPVARPVKITSGVQQLSIPASAANGHAVTRAGLQNGLTAVVGQRFWLELDFEHFFPPLSVAEQWSAPGVPELLSPRSRLSGAVGVQLFW